MLGTLEKHDTKTFDLTCFVGEVQSIVQCTVLWIYIHLTWPISRRKHVHNSEGVLVSFRNTKTEETPQYCMYIKNSVGNFILHIYTSTVPQWALVAFKKSILLSFLVLYSIHVYTNTSLELSIFCSSTFSTFQFLLINIYL